MHGIKHAAILFAFGHIDERMIYNKARVCESEYQGYDHEVREATQAQNPGGKFPPASGRD